MKSRRYLAVFCGLVLLAATGCSSQVQYRAGLYTKSVEGVFRTERLDPSDQPFVLVLDYHRTFLETNQGNLNRVTAFVAYPDEKGRYSIPFDVDTVKLELTFYAQKSKIKVQQFSRTLGVGGFRYNVNLKEDKNWRNSYYLMIKPILVEFITEKRYLMTERDKYFIGEWLSRADEQL